MNINNKDFFDDVKEYDDYFFNYTLYYDENTVIKVNKKNENFIIEKCKNITLCFIIDEDDSCYVVNEKLLKKIYVDIEGERCYSLDHKDWLKKIKLKKERRLKLNKIKYEYKQ